MNEESFYKRMSTGRYVDLNNFTEQDVDMFDIEVSLNNTIRFNGHHRDNPPLTVAQHTFLVWIIAKEWLGGTAADLLDCVLHDFPEAYYGDIATPVKKALGIDNLQFIKDIDASVYAALHPTKKVQHSKIRAKADAAALDVERRSMWNSQLGLEYWPLPPKESEKFSLSEKKALFDLVSNIPYVNLNELYDASLREYLKVAEITSTSNEEETVVQLRK